jgi:hypothetical protein
MPHERGLLPVLPFRLLLHCYRRSQSSLLLLAACQSTSINRKPADPVDPRALNFALFSAPECLAQLRLADFACPFTRLKTRR